MNKFIVIVPVYNAREWIDKCLESILIQDYTNYELVVIDDCSTDGTYEIINEIHNKHNNSFIVCRNENRIGSALANIVKAIELFSNDKEDIIVTVDGDDTLHDSTVLTYLDTVYQDKDIYMTYGSFIPLSGKYKAYGMPIPDIRKYRKSGLWLTSHLRTFKNKLWYLVNDNDLRDTDGKYYTVAWDNAFMYPLLELCGTKHYKCVDKVLYIYNDMSPMNDMKINKKAQGNVSNYIRSMDEYTELTEPI